jgi:hypothetical protein
MKMAGYGRVPKASRRLSTISEVCHILENDHTTMIMRHNVYPKKRAPKC